MSNNLYVPLYLFVTSERSLKQTSPPLAVTEDKDTERLHHKVTEANVYSHPPPFPPPR